MEQILQFFVLTPIVAFFLSLLIPNKKESLLSGLTIGMAGLHFLGISAFIVYWLMHDHPVLDSRHLTLFKAPDFEIFIDFFFDKVAAAYALVGSALIFLVSIFSKYYMHRESGFKRFFSTLLMFYIGYTVVVFSGNFETMFFGWELLGISSFLLIAFYRDRYLPVKNGLKVISVYRFSDICLFAAMWLSHHLWHENITFIRLGDASLVQSQIMAHAPLVLTITILLLMAAAIKSAQLPFSSWLSRAMEGPTASSAIFYGSLSVHIGVFLLLRTYPFWANLPYIQAAVIAIGLITGIVASLIARVQPTVKTQIVYSSIAQIGIMFIEVALGFHILALIHFACNAFLRTYQLLVSPSVLSYLTHDQFYNFSPRDLSQKDSPLTRLKNACYILSIKEWNIDFLLQTILWDPFKWVGRKLNFLTHPASLIAVVLVFLFGCYCFFFKSEIQGTVYAALPAFLSFTAFLLILNAFTERAHAVRAWILVFASQVFLALAISINDNFALDELAIYLSGAIISSVVGFLCLQRLRALKEETDLNGFHGYTHEQPTLAFLFLLACLGIAGFPITPTFLGFDLMFSHIRSDQYVLITFTSLSFVFIELTVLRIYARLFLGQHKKAYHPIAYRSS